MEYKVIFKKRFAKNLLNVLTFPEQNWSKKVADDFLLKVIDVVSLLKIHPHIDAPSRNIKNVRGLEITPHNKLFYRLDKNKIIIVTPADTRRKNYKQ